MKKFLLLLSLPTALFLSSCEDDDDIVFPTPVPPAANTRPNVAFTGLTADGRLLTYSANSTDLNPATTTISGLQAGETIQAIDYRPGTGQLYGISSQSRLYIINTLNGASTVVGVQFATPISGGVTGFDFNPTVDRIRIVSGSGQNLRVHPETGAVTTDTNISGAGTFGGAAYTNSVSGATTTDLFAIDFTNKTLVKSSNPNGGIYASVGALGVSFPAAGEFDISPDNSNAFAMFNFNGVSRLYSINLTSGAATFVYDLSASVVGFAIKANPIAYAVQGTSLLIINPTAAAATPVTKAITGTTGGEVLVGIDIRPATGGLYGLGTSGQLYLLNTSTGAATAVGAPQVLVGTSFGFDFNPTVDRIRVVSNTGQNLRLNPNDGALAATDTPLSPGSPAVSACAYTNNFPGATNTALYYVDHNTDMLYTSSAPNAGVLTTVGALGVNVESANGFDISGTTVTAYGAFTVGGATKLYTVNISTGSATAIRDLPAGVNGLAVGYNF